MQSDSSIFSELTNQYSLSKTLRFELKPIGQTSRYLKDFNSEYIKQVVAEDEQRNEDYKEVKKIVDEFHRSFINECLINLKEAGLDLENAFVAYEETKQQYSKSQSLEEVRELKKKARDAWHKVQVDLKKKIAASFPKSKQKALFSADLFKKEIPASDFLSDAQKDLASKFLGFTTYFSGFNQNRENIYKDSGSTAIAHRLVEDNLPKFFENIRSFRSLRQNHPEIFHDFEVIEEGRDLDTVFTPNYFLQCLTQAGIDSYNQLLAGSSNNTCYKQQGINELINLYKQKKAIKSLPKMFQLFKQILSEKELVEEDKEIISDEHLFRSLVDLQESLRPAVSNIITLFDNLEALDLIKVNVKNDSLSFISQKIFSSYSVLPDALKYYADNCLLPSGNFKSKAKREKELKAFVGQEVFSLAFLQEVLDYYRQHSEVEIDEDLKVTDLILKLDAKEIDENWENVQTVIQCGEISSKRNIPKDENDTGGEGFQQVSKIQGYLNSCMSFLHCVKPLYLVKKGKALDVEDIDKDFYADFTKYFVEIQDLLVPTYNLARNYLTKKPYSKKKIKLNFQNSTLLHGWDVNKERDNSGVLFLKEGQYFLGIIHKNHRRIFDFQGPAFEQSNICSDSTDNCYQKVFYKYLAGPNKMLPKVFFSKSRIDEFAPSEEIIRIRNTGSHTKSGKPAEGFSKADFNIDDCRKMIDFFKKSIDAHEDWKHFNFEFKPTHHYDDISQFYKDVSDQGYKISFENIKSSYIDECVAEGKMLLFQIYNKDFSSYSKGKPNLHTMYWREVFEPWLLGREANIKLNGEAEIFYREHSINIADAVVHKKGDLLDNKNPNNEKKTSVFEYDIVKDRRYTFDKFFFHVPLALNYKSGSSIPSRFNDHVNHLISNNPNVHILGIDRGEKNLLYYTVINQRGEIVEQQSLNVLVSNFTTKEHKFRVDYHNLLNKKEYDRKKSRESWSTIENIKELKQGYLSHVVHKLAEVITKYNAIVILEDLNFGFKRSRMKIEKQVYQNFELALAKKLNYLVFKDTLPGSTGSVGKAYQLAPLVNNPRDLLKQSGIMFYVNPTYTSKIDPLTGFVNLLDLRYKNIADARKLFNTFKSVRYVPERNHFVFDIDYSKSSSKKDLGSKTHWEVCTVGDKRYQYNHKTKSHSTLDVTQELKDLFSAQNIAFTQGEDLKEVITEQRDSKFFRTLMHLLKLTMTLRHCNSEAENEWEKDYILSPVEHPEHGFFDSRNVINKYPDRNLKFLPLPLDSDANGAYHIALKGLLHLEQINSGNGLKLSIGNREWFEFIHAKRNPDLVYQ